MPTVDENRLGCKRPATAGDSDDRAERVERDGGVAEFLACLRRSKRKPGNLWAKLLDGRTVCIFKDPHGRYRWSIADGHAVRYAPLPFRSQERAAEHLLDTLDAEGGV
jgi:hypothetical protein